MGPYFHFLLGGADAVINTFCLLAGGVADVDLGGSKEKRQETFFTKKICLNLLAFFWKLRKVSTRSLFWEF